MPAIFPKCFCSNILKHPSHVNFGVRVKSETGWIGLFSTTSRPFNLPASGQRQSAIWSGRLPIEKFPTSSFHWGGLGKVNGSPARAELRSEKAGPPPALRATFSQPSLAATARREMMELICACWIFRAGTKKRAQGGRVPDFPLAANFYWSVGQASTTSTSNGFSLNTVATPAVSLVTSTVWSLNGFTME